MSGILKAKAVQLFAVALKDAGIDDFGDLTEERLTAAEQLIRKILNEERPHSAIGNKSPIMLIKSDGEASLEN